MTLPEKEAMIKQRKPLMVEMERVMREESKRFKTVLELAEFAGYTARTLCPTGHFVSDAYTLV